MNLVIWMGAGFAAFGGIWFGGWYLENHCKYTKIPWWMEPIIAYLILPLLFAGGWVLLYYLLPL